MPIIVDVTLSRSERELLKAVYRLTHHHAVATTGALAGALDLAPGTVTAQVKRMAERGLLAYQPYHGVELSDDGRRAAVDAIRRHRIVERFLADMLGYPWHEADQLAPSFEHDLPAEVLERLYVALDRPVECPHGFPIPAPEVDELPRFPTLYSLQQGDHAVVAVPGSTDPEIVTFLDTMGVRPGVEVEVREKHPFEGPLVLRVGGRERTLGAKVAQQIYVQRSADRAEP